MDEIISCLKNHIDRLLPTGKQITVAIDGNCTAGKTTLASVLEAEYDCNLFRMDEFFLRPEQRTAARYAQPGGNVDYERFMEEVVKPLASGCSFSYRPFSCQTFTLSEPVHVTPKKLNIIEGTYSQHPYFGDIYDLRIFLSVSEELQRERILRRPPMLHERFFSEWIPMEKLYFDYFRISAGADLALDMSAAKLISPQQRQ